MSSALAVVGRESEIDSVHDFLEAVSGGPIALLIEGEAGIGKTTLWREGIAEARERGLHVLTSRPVEAEIALPFAVLGDLLGDVPDATLGRLPDPQREALEVALLRAGARPEGLQRRAVALGVLGALRVLAEDMPLVLAIDDVQWLDPPSADALAFAARRLRDEPVGFLLARRAEASEESRVELETALDSDRVTRLVIGPLDIRSLDRLLRAQLDRQFLRPALVEAMIRATAKADRVVMYTAFEKTQIRHLQQAVPHLATELAALEAKLLDLAPVVRNCVYHPDFRGSFSLKYVLTPMVPDLTYNDLVIVDGRVASVEIARLLFVADKIPRHERDRVRQDLLNYCERDTWAMVRLLERLRELAPHAG